mgnify:CR=1 FL=1
MNGQNDKGVVLSIQTLLILLGLLGAAHPIISGGLAGPGWVNVLWAAALVLAGIMAATLVAWNTRAALEKARQAGAAIPGELRLAALNAWIEKQPARLFYKSRHEEIFSERFDR